MSESPQTTPEQITLRERIQALIEKWESLGGSADDDVDLGYNMGVERCIRDLDETLDKEMQSADPAEEFQP